MWQISPFAYFSYNVVVKYHVMFTWKGISSHFKKKKEKKKANPCLNPFFSLLLSLSISLPKLSVVWLSLISLRRKVSNSCHVGWRWMTNYRDWYWNYLLLHHSLATRMYWDYRQWPRLPNEIVFHHLHQLRAFDQRCRWVGGVKHLSISQN